MFAECLAINPHDKPSELYIERAHFLKQTPPPEDWTGVWVMESK
jgi:adenylate cyclase